MRENKKQKPILVSVIVPIYNSEKYLSRCIESICDQTYKNIEIILVNDGSKDGSLKIAEDFSRNDCRVVIINQKNSGGVIARKNGVQRAKGDYVIIEDSDDWLEKDLIERCVEAISAEEDVDIVKFGYVCEPSKREKNVLGDGLVTKRITTGKELNRVIELLLYGVDCNPVWNEMVKRELFDFDDEIFNKIVHKGEDLQINLQIFQKSKKVMFLRDNLYHYVDNPNGITNSIDTNKIVNNIKDSIYLNEIRKKIAIDRFGYVDDRKLINKTLSALSGKIIGVLANSDHPQNDLIEIQENLKEVLPIYIGNFSSQELKQNRLKKMICKNIIKGDYLRNLRFRFICRVLKRVGRIK